MPLSIMALDGHGGDEDSSLRGIANNFLALEYGGSSIFRTHVPTEGLQVRTSVDRPSRSRCLAPDDCRITDGRELFVVH